MLGFLPMSLACTLASSPSLPTFPLWAYRFHLLDKPHGYKGWSQCLPLGKDTGFAVRSLLPTTTVCGSGSWESQELMGQQCPGEQEWRAAGGSPENLSNVWQRVSSFSQSKGQEGMWWHHEGNRPFPTPPSFFPPHSPTQCSTAPEEPEIAVIHKKTREGPFPSQSQSPVCSQSSWMAEGEGGDLPWKPTEVLILDRSRLDVYKWMHAQLCPALCNPMDFSLPGSSVHGILQNTGVGCHFLLQGIFSTQGSKPGLL